MANVNAQSRGLARLTSSLFNAEMSDHVRAFLIIFMLGNLVWMAFVSLSLLPNWLDIARVLGTSGLLSGAALICGGLLGFVFGIPRVLTSSSPTVVVSRQDAPNAQQAGQPQPVAQQPGAQVPPAQQNPVKATPTVAANTNLEQISDWLTKVLVGIGLTQIEKLDVLLVKVSDKLAPSLSPLPNGGIIAISIVAAFGVAGFSWAYFESRTSFMKVFSSED